MNYCSVAYTFYETDHRVRRYAELYTQEGNTVHSISLRRDGGDKPQLDTVSGVKLFFASRRILDEKDRFSYLWKIIRFFVKGSLLLTVNHFRYRYAIIHIHNVPDFLVFMAVIPKLFGAKVILDIHDIMPELYCEKFGRSFSSSLAKMLLFLEYISVKFADYTIVANDLWLHKIRTRTKHPVTRCCALLNYPNLTIFNAGTNPERRSGAMKLIYPGHISYHHGIDIAVRAFSIIKQAHPDATFEIYARTFVSSFRGEIDSLIQELGLQAHLRISSCLEPHQVAQKMREADIGIVPKRGGLFASEAFSTKILEFFAVGIPVIASRTAIDEYYFTDSTIEFFDDGSHESLAATVLRLYDNPRRRRLLSENGLHYVEKNNWNVKSQIFRTIVEKIIYTPV